MLRVSYSCLLVFGLFIMEFLGFDYCILYTVTLTCNEYCTKVKRL